MSLSSRPWHAESRSWPRTCAERYRRQDGENGLWFHSRTPHRLPMRFIACRDKATRTRWPGSRQRFERDSPGPYRRRYCDLCQMTLFHCGAYRGLNALMTGYLPEESAKDSQSCCFLLHYSFRKRPDHTGSWLRKRVICTCVVETSAVSRVAGVDVDYRKRLSSFACTAKATGYLSPTAPLIVPYR